MHRKRWRWCHRLMYAPKSESETKRKERHHDDHDDRDDDGVAISAYYLLHFALHRQQNTRLRLFLGKQR